MRKQSIKKVIWRMGGRRRRKQTRFFPIGTLAGPLLGGIVSNLAVPIIKKYNRWQTTKAM